MGPSPLVGRARRVDAAVREVQGGAAMKELVFHRRFFPAIERWPQGRLPRRRLPRARSRSTSTACCGSPTRCARELGVERGDRFAVMARQQPPVPRAVPRRRSSAPASINPLNLRLRRQGAGVHPRRLRHRRSCFVDALFADTSPASSTRCAPSCRCEQVVLIGDGDAPHDVALRGPARGGRRRSCPTSPRRTTPSCSCTRAAPPGCRRACCSTSAPRC